MCLVVSPISAGPACWPWLSLSCPRSASFRPRSPPIGQTSSGCGPICRTGRVFSGWAARHSRTSGRWPSKNNFIWCGLIKRDSLPDVDIGFAFLAEFRSQGYALEATRAVLEQGKHCFGPNRIVAITSPDNPHSIKLLAKIGFTLEQTLSLTEGEPEVNLYSCKV